MSRAHIQTDYTVGGVAIQIVRPHASGSVDTADVVHGGRLEWVTRSPEASLTVPDYAPTLRLDDATARALLDALADHYGGTNGVRTIREDFLHERGRVDRLITALIDGGTR